MDLVIQQYLQDPSIPQEKKSNVSRLLETGEMSNEKVTSLIREKYGSKYDDAVRGQLGKSIQQGVVGGFQQGQEYLGAIGEGMRKRNEALKTKAQETAGIMMSPLALPYALTGGDEGIMGSEGTLGFITEPAKFAGRAGAGTGEQIKEGAGKVGRGLTSFAKTGADIPMQYSNMLFGTDYEKMASPEEEASMFSDIVSGGTQALAAPVTGVASEVIKGSEALQGGAQYLASILEQGKGAVEGTIRAARPDFSNEQVEAVAGNIYAAADVGSGAAMAKAGGFLKNLTKGVAGKAATKIDDVMARLGGKIDDLSSKPKTALKTILKTQDPEQMAAALRNAGVKGDFAQTLSKLDDASKKTFLDLLDSGKTNYLDRVGTENVFEVAAKPVKDFIESFNLKSKDIGSKLGAIKNQLSDTVLDGKTYKGVMSNLKQRLKNYNAIRDGKFDFDTSDLADAADVKKIVNRLEGLSGKAATYRDLDSVSKAAGAAAKKIAQAGDAQTAKALGEIKGAIDDVFANQKGFKQFKGDYAKIKQAEKMVEKTMGTKVGDKIEIDAEKFLRGLNQKAKTKWSAVDNQLRKLEELLGKKLPSNLRENAFLAEIAEQMTGRPQAQGMPGMLESVQGKMLDKAAESGGKIGLAAKAYKQAKSFVGINPDDVVEQVGKIKSILTESGGQMSVIQNALNMPAQKATELFESLYKAGIITQAEIEKLPAEIVQGILKTDETLAGMAAAGTPGQLVQSDSQNDVNQ